jgi:hypothetical protein
MSSGGQTLTSATCCPLGSGSSGRGWAGKGLGQRVQVVGTEARPD